MPVDKPLPGIKRKYMKALLCKVCKIAADLKGLLRRFMLSPFASHTSGRFTSTVE